MPVVLVVEDDFDSRTSIASVLKDEGYTVITACDGVEALDAIHNHPRPDVVLLDLMMPDLDGWGVVKAKNADDGVKDIPVVVLTASNSQVARVGGLDGVQLLIHKPFNLEQLLRAITLLTKA